MDDVVSQAPRSKPRPTGPVRLCTARYSYNPHDGPNEHPEAELPLVAGKYLYVHGAMDDDGFYQGELLDGQRGLVPSNFVEFIQDKERAPPDGPDDPDHGHPGPTGPNGVVTPDGPGAALPGPCGEGPGATEGLAGEEVPYPRRISLIKQLARSAIVAWEPPAGRGGVEGYHVLVDGEVRGRVPWGGPTKLLVERLELSACTYRVCVQCVSPRGVSDCLRCTVLVGRGAAVAPTGLRLDAITRDSAQLSWLPSDSNYGHAVLLDEAEHAVVGPCCYRLRFTDLKATTVYKVRVVAKPHQVPWHMPLEQREKKDAAVEFCTQAAGPPQPPNDVKVQCGQAPGILQVHWTPPLLTPMGTSNGANVIGYAVCTKGQKIAEVLYPLADYASVDLSRLQGLEAREVVVRTLAAQGESQDSHVAVIPNGLLMPPPQTHGPPHHLQPAQLRPHPPHPPHPHLPHPPHPHPIHPVPDPGAHLQPALLHSLPPPHVPHPHPLHPGPDPGAHLQPLPVRPGQVPPHLPPRPLPHPTQPSPPHLRPPLGHPRPPIPIPQPTIPMPQPHIPRLSLPQPHLETKERGAWEDTSAPAVAQHGHTLEAPPCPTNRRSPSPQRILPQPRGTLIPDNMAKAIAREAAQRVAAESGRAERRSQGFHSQNSDEEEEEEEEEEGYRPQRRGASVDEFLRGSELGRQPHCSHSEDYQTESSRGSDLSDIMEEDEEELYSEMQHEEGRRRNSHSALKVGGNMSCARRMERDTGRRPAHGGPHPHGRPLVVPSIEITAESNSEGKPSPLEEDAHCGRVVRGRGAPRPRNGGYRDRGRRSPPCHDGSEPEDPFRIFVALFDYDPLSMSPNPDAADEELPFKEGQIIKIYGDKDTDGFYRGEARARSGLIPCNMVSEIQAEDEETMDQLMRKGFLSLSTPVDRIEQSRRGGRHPVATRRMVALYDYDPRESSPNADVEAELTFCAGDIMAVFGEIDEDGFYYGEINGHRGLVPSNFLEEVPDDVEVYLTETPSRPEQDEHPPPPRPEIKRVPLENTAPAPGRPASPMVRPLLPVGPVRPLSPAGARDLKKKKGLLSRGRRLLKRFSK